MADDVRILYKGKLALTAPQAAQRYGLEPDAMRQAILRLKRAGALTELPAALDGRTKLYLAADLDRAMRRRPGKGANLRRIARKASPPAPRPPADYVPYDVRRPYVVADSLNHLNGPTRGVITLPHHLDWSGSPAHNLDTPGVLAEVYRTVLAEAGTVADLNTWLNRDQLRKLWPTLWLPSKLRRLWEDRFPELAATGTHSRVA